jgi:hypothetical protein
VRFSTKDFAGEFVPYLDFDAQNCLIDACWTIGALNFVRVAVTEKLFLN